MVAPAQAVVFNAGRYGMQFMVTSLAGIDLGGGEGGEAQEAMELCSLGFYRNIYQKNNLAVEVFAAEGMHKITIVHR